MQLHEAGALRQLPGERMLATPGPHDEHLHAAGSYSGLRMCEAAQIPMAGPIDTHQLAFGGIGYGLNESGSLAPVYTPFDGRSSQRHATVAGCDKRLKGFAAL